MNIYKYYNIIVFNILLFCISTVLGQRVDIGLVANDKIDEASGIASSKNNKNLIWTHNDSGNLGRVYAIGSGGSHLGMLRLQGIIPIDWEDMCIGPGPKKGVDYIYIGDIGDNFGKIKKKRIFRFEEPILDLNSSSEPFDIKINDIEKITFRYPDTKRDAETLMIDPITGDLYILTKRESSVYMYSLPFPQSTDSVILADHIGNLTISPEKPYRLSDKVVSGDISRDGSMMLIKTYYQIILIMLDLEDPITHSLKSNQILLDYILEPQGEALCWSSDQMGYFTLSEETRGNQAHLYFYPLALEK